MRLFCIVSAAAGSLIASSSLAAPVAVQVLGLDGRPLIGAVVIITVPGTAMPAPRGSYVVSQRDIQFAPRLLIVPVGATVTFPNLDKVRHHVYSFSKAKRFELKLFGREDNRSVTFDQPGAVALGCNIHDAMNGVIYVTASPYTAVTGADGRVRLDVGSARAATASVWHPSIRRTGNILSQPVAIGPNGLSTTLQLRR